MWCCLSFLKLILGSFGGRSVEDQSSRAGGWSVQVGIGGDCAAAVADDGYVYRTLTVICGTIGDFDGARRWSERASQEMDMCNVDMELPVEDA